MHVEQLYSINGAAAATGVQRSDLSAAVSSGEVRHWKTADDAYRLVKLDDVQAWADARRARGRGRPRKEA